MSENDQSDYKKISDAILCARKSIQCTLCQKIPTEPTASKCGHIFCKTCVNKILNTKKSVCATCKTGITRSGIHEVKHVLKIAEDLASLCKAIEKDSNFIISLDKIQTVKQAQGKRRSLTLPGPSVKETTGLKNGEQNVSRRRRQESIASLETIKIQEASQQKIPDIPSATASTSTAAGNIYAPVFTADNLSVTIGAIGSQEKVDDWLKSQKFKDKNDNESETEPKVAESIEPESPGSTVLSTVLERFSQGMNDSDNATKNGRTTRAKSKSSEKRARENSNSSDNTSKFKSFTSQAINNRKNLGHRKIVTPAEKMFDTLRRSSEEFDDNRKARAASVLTEESWSDIALLKKETRSKVRKRKKLNISIERPSCSNSVVRQSDEKQVEKSVENREEDGTAGELNVSSQSTKQKQTRSLIISSRELLENEKFDFKKLTRREVKNIIGINCSQENLDDSKVSGDNLDESIPKSNNNELPLSKSGECSKDRVNEGDEYSRPQSKISFHGDNSRPGSKMSCISNDKPVSEKFRLSMKRKSTTPNTSPEESCGKQNTPPRKREEEEKIKLSQDTPIRLCDNSMRQKLTTKRLSIDSRGSTNVSIKKLGKLCKTRKRFKFLRLGSINSDLPRKESIVTTRNRATQTSPCLLERYLDEFTKKRNAQIQTAHNSEIQNSVPSTSRDCQTNIKFGELNTVNKVNMLSPEKDSQLKFLDIRSPVEPRIDNLDSNKTIPKQSRESSTNSKRDEYTKAVRNYAEKLIVTDSEDQDTPTEGFESVKRKNICEVERNGWGKGVPSITTSVSRSVSTLSDPKMKYDGIEGSASPDIVVTKNTTSQNNPEELLPLPSPRREKYSRTSNESQTKKRKSQSNLSGSCAEYSSQSIVEALPYHKALSKGDSEASVISTKHKVVRKLKYNQESRLKSSEPTEPIEQKIANLTEKKTFQRIKRYPSTDSENDSLEISLTKKQSSSNSQTLSRPGPSSEVNKSPILSEDMTIVFSSNKDTQESKRKRSPSPQSLDNDAIQAIASNWCADLDRSSEEIATTHNSLLGRGKNVSVINEVPLKKARVEIHDSPNSDEFPALSPTAIYGKKNRSMKTGEAEKNEEENMQTAGIGKQVEVVKTKDMRNFNEAVDTENLVIRANTFTGVIIRSRNSTPIKSKSFEHRESPVPRQISHNSDKENQAKEYANKLPDSRGRSEEEKNPAKLNSEHVTPTRGNSASNTQPLNSSYDRDYMNITQEELLLQEVEANLLGKSFEKSNKKAAEKRASENETKSAKRRPRGYKVAEIPSDDSDIIEEDIVESTPEKIAQSKKDLYTVADNSQRSHNSLKSFMSVDITPIAKKIVPRNIQRVPETSPSPHMEQSVKPKGNDNEIVSKTQYTRHSTPKVAASAMPSLKMRQKLERRFCFVCSSLTPLQIQNVKLFASKHNAEYTTNYRPEVTHVIVDTDEKKSAGRTLKYLLGVAKKNWIVSYEWVSESMSKDRILDEEQYEALDRETEEPGPRRSRLSNTDLFRDFAFVCMKPFTDITIEQLQDLLSSMGGTVMGTLEDLASVSNKRRVILYNCDIHELAVLEKWQRRGAAMPVQVEWVLSCISQYELTSFREYLQDINPEIALELGFPTDFILDELNSSGGANDSSIEINK